MAESNRYTIGVQLRNLSKKLGDKVDAPINQVQRRDLEAFVQARLKERVATTVSKERETVVQFFDWAVANSYLTESPAVGLTKVKASGDLPPFRTAQEIEAIIARGGLGQAEINSLWDCLYLAPEEIRGILQLLIAAQSA